MLTLLKNAHVFSPSPLGQADVLLASGQIQVIASDLGELPQAIPHQVFDLSGHVIIPGLIDAHVLASGGGGEAGPSTRVPPISLSHITVAGDTSCVGVL